MKILKMAMLMGGVGLALAANARAADLPTKKQAAVIAPACFDSFKSWALASVAECPLTFHGITLYGTIDVGGDYMSHGAAFNRDFSAGVNNVIQKNSNNARYSIAPNGLSQSNIGVKVNEPLNSDLSFVGRAEIGFDPYSLQLANSPKSLVDNNGSRLATQSANGDSSRAGQIFNSQIYAGLSSKTFGTLTFGRVNTLTLDGVNSYDPMGGSNAFSVIGYSGVTAGVGDTGAARVNTAFKYNVAIGQFRLAALAQVGGYEQGNGSNGTYQGQIGADFGGLSVDAIYSYVKDSVALSNFATAAAPAPVANWGQLKATLSNDSSVMLLAKYTFGQLKVFGGYEYIRYGNPSDKYGATTAATGGFITVLGGFPGQVQKLAFGVNKDLQVFWTGAKYAIRPDLDITGAYYRYSQNTYFTGNCAGAPPAGTIGPASGACAGNLNAYSAMIDYRPIKRLDLYAGFMYSQVDGGLSSGFLHNSNIDPTVGLRVQF